MPSTPITAVNGSDSNELCQLSGSSQCVGQQRKAMKYSNTSHRKATATHEPRAIHLFAFKPQRLDPTKIQKARCAKVHTSKKSAPVVQQNQFITSPVSASNSMYGKRKLPLVCRCNDAYSTFYHKPHKSVSLARSPFVSRDNENRLVCPWVCPLSEDFQHQQ